MALYITAAYCSDGSASSMFVPRYTDRLWVRNTTHCAVVENAGRSTTAPWSRGSMSAEQYDCSAQNSKLLTMLSETSAAFRRMCSMRARVEKILRGLRYSHFTRRLRTTASGDLGLMPSSGSHRSRNTLAAVPSSFGYTLNGSSDASRPVTSNTNVLAKVLANTSYSPCRCWSMRYTWRFRSNM